MRLSKIESVSQAHSLPVGKEIFLPRNCSSEAPKEIAAKTAGIISESRAMGRGILGSPSKEAQELRSTISQREKERDEAITRATAAETRVVTLTQQLESAKASLQPRPDPEWNWQYLSLAFLLGGVVVGGIVFVVMQRKLREAYNEIGATRAATLPREALVRFEGVEYVFPLDENSYICPLCNARNLNIGNLAHHLHSKCQKMREGRNESRSQSDLHSQTL